MEFEFMTKDTPTPQSMPLPKAALRLPVSSTAKVMYARMLDTALTDGIEDVNEILFHLFSNHGTVGGDFTQPYDRQAFPERTGRSRADFARTSGHRGTQQNICTYPKDGG